MKVLIYDTSLYAPSSPLFAGCEIKGTEIVRFDDARFLTRLRQPVSRTTNRFAQMSLASASLNASLQAHLDEHKPEVFLVVKGQYVDPRLIRRAKERGSITVNFSTDDPFNAVNATRRLVKGIPEYDFYFTPRRRNVGDLLRAGARRVELTQFGYKPDVHFPESPASDVAERYAADLAFIGAADQDRVEFLQSVVRARPSWTVALYGSFWRRTALARFDRGGAYGTAFRFAVCSSRLCLSLVRRANRDSHVMRTFEVPACGGVLLTDRTEDHEGLFEDRKEALLFGSAAELVELGDSFLDDEVARAAIASAGHASITRGNNTYQARLSQILGFVTSS